MLPFILPFLLFSATSGRLADKIEKTVLIRFVKTLEIAVMALAGWGFMQQHMPALLACVGVAVLGRIVAQAVRLAKAIPIAPQREDPTACERAFEEARRVLDEGDLLGIFPEGGITRDGSLGESKGGLMKILQTHPVPVVPLALHKL